MPSPPTHLLRAASFSLLGLALGLPACQKSLEYSGTWPWVPNAVELHGLSRFIATEDTEFLSLRVEFLDQNGDPTKFPGEVVILVTPEFASDSEKRRYNFDLSELEVNERYWDRVTSTYRFKLESSWEEPPLPTTPIRVQLEARLGDGQELDAGITLRRGG